MSKRGEKRTCATCRCWEGYGGERDLGQCRRHAPTAWLNTVGLDMERKDFTAETVWPETYGFDDCWDWKRMREEDL